MLEVIFKMNTVDLHLAKKKMKIKKINSKFIFLSTVWKGEVIMGIFDTASNKLLQINCFRELEFGETEDLENLIINCLQKNK